MQTIENAFLQIVSALKDNINYFTSPPLYSPLPSIPSKQTPINIIPYINGNIPLGTTGYNVASPGYDEITVVLPDIYHYCYVYFKNVSSTVVKVNFMRGTNKTTTVSQTFEKDKEILVKGNSVQTKQENVGTRYSQTTTDNVVAFGAGILSGGGGGGGRRYDAIADINGIVAQFDAIMEQPNTYIVTTEPISISGVLQSNPFVGYNVGSVENSLSVNVEAAGGTFYLKNGSVPSISPHIVTINFNSYVSPLVILNLDIDDTYRVFVSTTMIKIHNIKTNIITLYPHIGPDSGPL